MKNNMELDKKFCYFEDIKDNEGKGYIDYLREYGSLLDDNC